MTHNTSALVVVGSGMAAWALIREFRKLDRQTPVTLVTRDSGDFYSKPMLSNALASGKSPADLVNTSRTAMAEQLAVGVMDHTDVHTIDAAAHNISTSRGPIGYRRLVLALGADPVTLPLQGNAADRVLSVNDLGDYAQFRKALETAKRVVIIGAGLIGCEFANDLVAAGYRVDMIDPASHPLGRLLPVAAGERLQQALTQAGVHFHLGTTVQRIDQADDGLSMVLANGDRLTGDVVLSAVGLRPRIALARRTGLHTARGIVVDRQLQTSASDIYALGDAAEVEGQVLPYVLPLMAAARTLAAHLAGQPAVLRYPAMPVAVKTPAMPLVVSPPAAGASGQWQIASEPEGIDARFISDDGTLLGFALAGNATARKATLQKMLPALIA